MSTDRRVPPRIGCVGVGWIGRHRMQCLVEEQAADVVALLDPSVEQLEAARRIAPEARIAKTLDELLDLDLQGVLIATPSALHADQAIAALRAGKAVFCQKPLARSGPETAAVLEAARAADRLLGVDFSYRHVAGVPQIRELVQTGELGEVFAVDLVFHNAYGPDKPWFHDPVLAGGGCLMDLGIHLLDLAGWTLGWPEVEVIDGRRYARGKRILDRTEVEDFACALLQTSAGTTVRVTCSWNLHAGRDAVIEAAFHGTSGGATLRNLDGSFYDFEVQRHRGTHRETIARPPDRWGGRSALSWARTLARSSGYDASIEGTLRVARTLDDIYLR